MQPRDAESPPPSSVEAWPTTPAREALPQAAAALDAAERQGRPQEICRALTRLARCYCALGAVSAAEEALREALRQACCMADIEAQADLLCQLAQASCLRAEQLAPEDHAAARAALERARDQAFEASRRACESADPRRGARIMLGIASVLDRCGDHDDATAITARARQLLGDARSQ